MTMNPNLLAVLILLFGGHLLLAQDFDADSVHYTKISKQSPSAKTRTIKITRDTLREKQLMKYFFNVQTGALLGCTNCSAWQEVMLSASTTHGISVGKKFRVGAGTGIDIYDQWKMMPLFGSLSYDIIGTRNKNAFFVQVNYGWAAAWRRYPFDGYSDYHAEGGQMMSAMAGYRIKYHDLNISIAAGPKTQRAYWYYEFQSIISYDQNGNPVYGTPNRTTTRQELNRFAISLAVGWK